MGLKLSTLWNFWSKKEVRIVVLGLDAAGKTATLDRLKLGETRQTIPTIGFNVETVEYKNLKLTMWDVGGQFRLRGLWHHYYQGVSCVIFVVDSSDRARHKEAGEELHRVMSADELRNASLLVLANKQDLPGALSVSEMHEVLKLRQLGQRRFFVQGCVATTGNGLWEGLDWLSANIPKETPA